MLEAGHEEAVVDQPIEVVGGQRPAEREGAGDLVAIQPAPVADHGAVDPATRRISQARHVVEGVVVRHAAILKQMTLAFSTEDVLKQVNLGDKEAPGHRGGTLMAVHTESDRTRPLPTGDDVRVVPTPEVRSLQNPAYQGFAILWLAFTVAPVLFGLDKFFDRMTDWGQYLAPFFVDHSPLDRHGTMLVVGVIEIVAGLVVAVRPRIGGYLVAAWLAGIIVDLLLLGGHADIALRDFGLFLAALALARLATSFRPALLRPERSGVGCDR